MEITRAKVDEAISTLADYAANYVPKSKDAFNTARLCLADTLGCGILALKYPACTKMLGPIVPGTVVPHGARVPGTPYVLDPVNAAFNIGTMIRWLDYNDTWLAAEWGHPSDNLGGLLATADYLDRLENKVTVHDLLVAMIKAHEIQGVLALENSFNRIGFDHVILVKIATTAIVTKMLGGTEEQIENAISNAFIDTGPLRTYRHAPNTGSRKSWAAGDQTSRGVHFALIAMKNEMGYPTALTAKNWGLYDVLFDGKPFSISRKLGSYVMENVLFKVSYPAEFHAQTAVEAAVKLHPHVLPKLDQIDRIEIETHESAVRIIDKTGPLNNPADRDHCLQYMTAVALLYGNLIADHYEDEAASDPRIDQLREKMVITEKPQYSLDYLDPDKRSIANCVRIHLEDGTMLEPAEVEYPIGHCRRREEATPLIFDKFKRNLGTRFDADRTEKIVTLFKTPEMLDHMRVGEFLPYFLG